MRFLGFDHCSHCLSTCLPVFDAFFGLALQLLLPSLPLESLKMILLKLEQTSGQRKSWRFFCRGGEIAIINVQEKGQQTEL